MNALAAPVDLREEVEYVRLKRVALAFDIQKILPRLPTLGAQVRITRPGVPVLWNLHLCHYAVHNRLPGEIGIPMACVSAQVLRARDSGRRPCNPSLLEDAYADSQGLPAGRCQDESAATGENIAG